MQNMQQYFSRSIFQYTTKHFNQQLNNRLVTSHSRSNRGSTMGASKASSGWDFGTENPSSPYSNKKVTMRSDLNLDEQREWEKQEMEKPVDFSELHIDPAPFQLVEKSSLLKVANCLCLNLEFAFFRCTACFQCLGSTMHMLPPLAGRRCFLK